MPGAPAIEVTGAEDVNGVSCIPLASTGSPLAVQVGLGGMLLIVGVAVVLLARALGAVQPPSSCCCS